jgi:hypothetical protein
MALFIKKCVYILIPGRDDAAPVECVETKSDYEEGFFFISAPRIIVSKLPTHFFTVHSTSTVHLSDPCDQWCGSIYICKEFKEVMYM